MMNYKDREEAGRSLAAALNEYKNKTDVIVLGLPRGGVPVAYEIAKRLHAPLDVFIVRKLGVPHHKELAMGAIAAGTQVFNQEIIDELSITPNQIQAAIAEEELELKRRELKYRENREAYHLKNKTVILVDDGIATGATIRAAIKALRQLNVKKLVIAVPVAQADMCDQIQMEADELVCPLRPPFFYSVSAWYKIFGQTEDAEVTALLRKSAENYAKLKE